MMPQGGNRMNGTAHPELVSEVEDSVPSPRMLDNDGPAPTGRGAASLPERCAEQEQDGDRCYLRVLEAVVEQF